METLLYCDNCHEFVNGDEFEREGISVFDELITHIFKNAKCNMCHSVDNVRLVVQMSDYREIVEVKEA